jgi:SAM-dependent methyltransferase
MIGGLHERHVAGRRVGVLARHFAGLLPAGARVLDVGCGDGRVARAVMDLRPDVAIRGIDVLLRGATAIPVEAFDGRRIPHRDGAFDCAMFVDVLHHAADPAALLGEAARVSRGSLLIKDHLLDAPFSSLRLRFMDWVGNARHGVALPYNYWPRKRWDEAFAALGLAPSSWDEDLGIYPPWADWLFGGRLHFIALLRSSSGR